MGPLPASPTEYTGPRALPPLGSVPHFVQDGVDGGEGWVHLTSQGDPGRDRRPVPTAEDLAHPMPFPGGEWGMPAPAMRDPGGNMCVWRGGDLRESWEPERE